MSKQIRNFPEVRHDENIIPIADARRYFPGNPPPAAIQRWLREGIKGISLESFLVGARRFTSQSAVERFILRTNGVEPVPAVPSPQAAAATKRPGRTELDRRREKVGLPEPITR